MGIRAGIDPAVDIDLEVGTVPVEDIGPAGTALAAGIVGDTAAFVDTVAVGDIVVADTAVGGIAAVAGAAVAADTDSDPGQSWELL